MVGFDLKGGDRLYKILLANGGPGHDGLLSINFFSKKNARGLIDCLLIYEYNDRQAVRKAKDFPPDQFEHFIAGVESRSSLPCRLIDGARDGAAALQAWHDFFHGDQRPAAAV